MKLSFLGLGVMGFPMAGHLANFGHDLVVYNRTSSKVSKWKDNYKGNTAETPKAASVDVDIVISCVGNDEDLREVTVAENGAFHSMTAGSIFIDHTTVSASITRELYNYAKDKGIFYIDAPISGGQVGAENAALSIMCGGDEATFNNALPVMDVYSKICKLMGPTGSGQLTKMVNQICIAGLVQGLSEGFRVFCVSNVSSTQSSNAISTFSSIKVGGIMSKCPAYLCAESDICLLPKYHAMLAINCDCFYNARGERIWCIDCIFDEEEK